MRKSFNGLVALTVTLGADISSIRRSLGGAMGVISGFAKRISGVFSIKGGIVGALAGGSTAALATKLNAAGEAGNTANARIQSGLRVTLQCQNGVILH